MSLCDELLTIVVLALVNLFVHGRVHDQSPRKHGTGPGLNSQPLDLQSDVLQTMLMDLIKIKCYYQ